MNHGSSKLVLSPSNDPNSQSPGSVGIPYSKPLELLGVVSCFCEISTKVTGIGILDHTLVHVFPAHLHCNQ